MSTLDRITIKNRFFITFVALMFVSSVAIGRQKTLEPQADFPVSSDEQNLTGTLEIIVGDPPPGSFKPPEYRFYLRQDNGHSSRLSLHPKLITVNSAITAWAGKRVKVSISKPGHILDIEKPGQVLSVSAVTLVAAGSKTGQSKNRQTIQAIQSGSKPWVTIFCKFADIPTEPDRVNFYENMYSNSPGGLDHYWRENSYELMNISGSAASVEWVELPGTLESYMTEMTEINGESSPSPDLDVLFDDCTNAAEELVDFSNAGNGFSGINMMFNERMGCCAWGGARIKELDGVVKTWGITWLPPWGHRQSIIAHEMGHAFGLPHSNNWDDDDNPYDNPWDVMSMADSTHLVVVPVYGELSPHTNAYHKYELGWMSGDRLLEVSPETTVSTILDAIAQSNTSNHQMVLIEVSENAFYTLETRKKTGTYETSLPDSAVIIYEVVRDRGEPSWAVDSDIPPADLGDNEGTMWRVGETFVNATGDIHVSVDAETTDGFRVTIENRGIKLSEPEVSALVDLYNSSGGDSWTNNTNWLVGDPCTDKWFGVECGFGSVQYLDLSDNNLIGSIPASIGNLGQLQALILSNNQLNDTIPTEIGQLTKLDQLLLDNNQLSGMIPAEIGELTKLGQLILGGNQLTGSIPADLGLLVNLWWLNLENNQLNGSIPTEIGDMANLYYLYLSSNRLSGSIPVQLDQLTNLRQLLLGENQLSGSIPITLGELVNFSWLDLENNQLNGSIPAEFGDLAELIFLGLSNNQLSGPIPTEIGNLVNLNYLLLYNNQLEGSIPVEIGNLTQLKWLWLDNNQLSGPIPVKLGGLTSLERMDLSSNQLSGAVPKSFKNLSNLLDTFGLYLTWNALHNDDNNLEVFLNAKSENDWGSSTQTIAPRRLRVSSLAVDSVILAWDPIEYTANGGGYRVWYAPSPGGPYLDGGITTDKNGSSLTVTGLNPGQRYFFIVKAETNRHANNKNIVISNPSNELSVTPTDGNFQINAGLNDAWYYPVTNGQGFFITVFPDIGYVSLSWFTYDTVRPDEDVTANLGEPGHRWLNALGIYSNNQAVLDISFASGGLFDTSTDITEMSDGTIILTFTDCENGTIEYDIPSIDHQGIVPIQRVVGENIAQCEAVTGQAVSRFASYTQTADTQVTTADPTPLVEMNAGLNDAWFYPETAGQGFFITVFPDLGYVLLSWFTYDTVRPDEDVTTNLGEPGHRWLNALGAYTDNRAVLDISFASGGLFDTSTEVTEIGDGAIILTFTDCENGTVEYDIPSIDRQGIIPVQRVVGDNVDLCETLNLD